MPVDQLKELKDCKGNDCSLNAIYVMPVATKHVNEMTMNKMSVYKMPVHETTVDKMRVKKMPLDRMTVNEITVDIMMYTKRPGKMPVN